MAGRPVPAAKGPIQRLRRRVTYGSLLTSVAAAAGAFGSNTFHLQDKACAAPQFVSDACGSLGLGSRPAKTERLAWQALRAGNCDDLKSFLGHFPAGTLGERARSLLADHHVSESPIRTVVTHQLVLRQSPSDTARPTLAQAKADALNRAQQNAVNLCNGFAGTSRYRFKSATIDVQQWDCEKNGGGFSCGFDGQAICELEERTVRTDESCGK